MARLWIAGHLIVDATREILPVNETGVPCNWLDTALPKSPEPVALRPDPILLRDKDGDVEALNWWDPDVDHPHLSPWDPVEVWVIEESSLADTPSLQNAIRFCVYTLDKLNSNIKSSRESKKIRHEILEEIDDGSELRSAIANHVLKVHEKDIFLPRNFLPLLGNQIDGRTLQNDLARIQQRKEESTPLEERRGNTAEINHSGITDPPVMEIKTATTDTPDASAAGHGEGDHPEAKTAGNPSSKDDFVEPANRQKERTATDDVSSPEPIPPQAAPTGRAAANTTSSEPHDKALSSEDAADSSRVRFGREVEENQHAEQLSGEHVEYGYELYKALRDVDPQLPEFGEIMHVLQSDPSDEASATKRSFIFRLIELDDHIRTTPSKVVAGVKDFLKKNIPSLGL
ncbi:hypothetical protein GM160_04285 [Guyparkeria halophila]|uniref:Uncharacterized protein n=1 Tax=Guyparkeria halophila TaxID=47960 RepID=A0A6I6D207_9GAMM|nr:hypothetical protein [Guyparkeria halophila]QGT78177.1 hypothetical protein GM160_04285 [Guyparkeria halophila]